MTPTPQQVHAKKAEITAPGAFFELETVELVGTQYRAYKHASKTLLEVYASARAHGDLEFLVYEEQRLSYNDFFAQADALAAVLQRQFGVVSGDRIAIAMRNNPQWAITFTAIGLIGAIAVPINSWGKSDELAYAITDSESRLMICDPQRFALVKDRLDELALDIILVGGEGTTQDRVYDFATAVEQGVGESFVPPEISGEDACVILYTSGSTGFPKGVLHNHTAVCQSLMNMFFLGFLTIELEGAREFKGGAERETPVLTVPLFHATGLLSGFLLPLQTAQKVVMMYKWDALAALQLIEAEKITSLSSVPAVVQDLLRHPEFDNYDTGTLIRVTGAGAATPAGLPELIAEKCGEPSRSAGWGMTETLAVGSTMSGVIYDLSPDSAGIVSPLVDFRFLDANGREVDAHTGGEMEVRSITCTPGYWQKPEANAETFDEQRWMKTGDVGRIDEHGYVHITGRIKEIVIRGGENIFPGEIEHVAYEQKAIKEVVVFGVPDDALGEEMVLVAYRFPGEALTEDQLRAYLSEKLAAYKVPRYIEFSAQPLPQNASAKLHKLKVKEAYLQR